MILCEWQCCGPSMSPCDSPPSGAVPITAIILSAAVDFAAARITGIVTQRVTSPPAPGAAMITAIIQGQRKWLLNISNAANRGALGKAPSNDTEVYS